MFAGIADTTRITSRQTDEPDAKPRVEREHPDETAPYGRCRPGLEFSQTYAGTVRKGAVCRRSGGWGIRVDVAPDVGTRAREDAER
jgi:hypothetical protein